MERLVVVRGSGTRRQGLEYFVGTSEKSCGARGLSLSLVTVAPGAAAEPHYHDGYETAIYVLEGRVETRYGPGLAETVVTEAGDFLFVPPAFRTSRSTSAEPTRHGRSSRGTTPTSPSASSPKSPRA